MRFINVEEARPARKGQAIWLAATAVVALALTGCGGSAEAPASDASQNHEVDQELRGKLPQAIVDRGVLRIGTVTSTNPFTQKPGKDVTGLIPDLAHEVGKQLGLDVEFFESPMASQVAALQADRADITWSAMTDTVEREQTINMLPFMGNKVAPIVQKGNPKNIQVLEDFCGNTVAAVRGGNSQPILEELQKNLCSGTGKTEMSVKLYDKSSEAMLQVQSGNADAFVGIGLQLRHIAETANGGTTFEYIDASLTEDQMAIGIAKENTDFAAVIQGALANVVDSGVYEEILKKYEAEEYALTTDQITVNPLSNAKGGA